MPKHTFYFLLFVVTSLSHFSFSQKDDLENKLSNWYKEGKYEEAQNLLLNITTSSTSNQEKFRAYLFLSDLRKRFSDYGKASYYLSRANGLANTTHEKNKVLARKAMVSFDTNDYTSSDSVLTIVESNNFKGLNIGETAILIMQKGFLFFLKKEYDKSFEYYEKSLFIMEQEGGCNSPIVYGKMLLLFAEQNKKKEAKKAYNTGVEIAKKCKTLKYEIYLAEEYSHSLKKMKLFDEAEKVDSLQHSLKIRYKEVENLQKLELNFEEKTKDKTSYSWIWWGGASLLLILGVIVFQKRKRIPKIVLEENKSKEEENLPLLEPKEEKSNPLLDNNEKTNPPKLDDLRPLFNKRQWEILNLMTAGKRNDEISDKLHISINTVKYHVTSINRILKENGMKFLRDKEIWHLLD